MSALLSWVRETIGVNRLSGAEVLTQCPRCGEEKFYFNLNKKVGWCHRASCRWSPTLSDLIDYVGYPPGAEGYYTSSVSTKEQVKVRLPDNFQLIKDPSAHWDYLKSRGLLYPTVRRFSIGFSGTKVYVPVYSGEELLSYVSRDIYKKGYLYPVGGKHGKTLLGWGEASNFSPLILVENTFVSLWLRDTLKLPATTNFGSHLSSEQVQLISKGHAKKVVILWDEGTDRTAYSAIRALKNSGVSAVHIKISGQPDDYKEETIKGWIDMGIHSKGWQVNANRL